MVKLLILKNIYYQIYVEATELWGQLASVSVSLLYLCILP